MNWYLFDASPTDMQSGCSQHCLSLTDDSDETTQTHTHTLTHTHAHTHTTTRTHTLKPPTVQKQVPPFHTLPTHNTLLSLTHTHTHTHPAHAALPHTTHPERTHTH